MKSDSFKLAVAATAATLTLTGSPLFASSHQLAILDRPANTTDVMHSSTRTSVNCYRTGCCFQDSDL